MIGMADRRNNRGLSLTVSPENRPYDVEEARLWLRDHRIEEVECVAPDFGGVPRGKAMPCAKFAEMKPIYMPVSIFFQTITGMYVEFEDQAVWAEHDLRLIPQALAHARRGLGIISQNVVFSIVIITVLLPLAITGVLGLAAVVLVHEVAEVLVILNGLRAARSPGLRPVGGLQARS